MQTTKQDWLNNALAESGCFVSGHPTTEGFIGITGRAEIRFVMLKGQKPLFFLTVSSPGMNYREAYPEAFRNGLLGWLRSMFQPLIQVFYSNEDQEFDVFYPPTGTFKKHSFEQLAVIIGQLDPNLIANVGTQKEINTSINDNFQKWTRAYLSTYCIVNDLDAFTVNMHQAVFFELKRVKESLNTWLPYVDDNRNYGALELIAKSHGGVAITLAYSIDDEEKVGLHRYLVPQERISIRGKMLLIDVITAINHPLSVDFSQIETYTSTNKRQK